MENDTEDSYLPPEDEGGPTKTFLEHLEDLRWVLMKCAASISVGFLLCLFASPALVRVLTWPLDHMDNNPVMQAIATATKPIANGMKPVVVMVKRLLHIHTHENEKPAEKPTLTFFVGTNRFGSFNLETNQVGLFGTNVHTALELAPITIGSNTFLGLKPLTNAPVIASLGQRRITLINLGPAAAFFLAVQMAIYGGIALGSPLLFYFIGSFIFPALRLKEKKYTYWGMFFGLGLFTLGACFCYFILMPVALSASWQYSEWMGFQATQWRAEEYIGFVSKFILGMGLGFELPVVLLVLVKIGILDYATLSKMRRYMIVINLVLGALLTTPEVVTQVLMAIPLQVLYEVSVWIAWYWERKEKKRLERLES